MKKLSEADIVQVVKDFEKNKPRTTYSLTLNGRKEFEDYVKRLEEIIKQASL
jgi:DNA-binding PadR family transcriptional regulator